MKKVTIKKPNKRGDSTDDLLGSMKEAFDEYEKHTVKTTVKQKNYKEILQEIEELSAKTSIGNDPRLIQIMNELKDLTTMLLELDENAPHDTKED